MLKVNLCELKTYAKDFVKNKGAKIKAVTETLQTRTAAKTLPAMVLLADGTVAMVAADTQKNRVSHYEPCSDFCCEVVG